MSTDGTLPSEGGTINGVQFEDLQFGTCESDCPNGPASGDIELNLFRKFRTLKATVGVLDSSEAGVPETIQVMKDGQSTYMQTFTLGKSQVISLNVTGVLRLSILFKGDFRYANPAVGDPTAYP